MLSAEGGGLCATITYPPLLVLSAENAALYAVSITNAVPPVIDRLPQEA